MEPAHNFTLLFVSAVALSLMLEFWLNARQARHVRIHRDQVPDSFAESIGLADHRKAADYTTAKLKLGSIHTVWSFLLLLAWTLGGGLQQLDSLWTGSADSALVVGTLVIVSFALIGALLDLPFSAYRTFVLEERFGFNNTQINTWLTDLLKSLVLSLAIGTPLVAVVLWLMISAGVYWWLWAWLVWLTFSLTMIWIFPTYIAPLFNKFSPLEDQELKRRIEQLMARCGFHSEGLFVMDGSRRSSHGNAYFTGLGQNKRIVFFDTLLERLNGEEIEAVLAHELGHFRLHHIRKRLFTSALATLAGLAVLGWLAQEEWFYAGLGVDSPSAHLALLLFLLVAPVFSLFLQPIGAYFQRKHEFEADAFAARHTRADDLVSALVKLYRDNASTLTPDPLYSAMHDSHPPAPIRVASLQRHAMQQPGAAS